MGFITVEELKDMPLPVTEKQWQLVTDPQMQYAIDASSYHIENWIDRRINLGSYTERIVGTNRYTLMLEQYPIVSLTSVASNDISESVTSYSTTDFLIHNGAGIIEFMDKLRYSFSNRFIWVVQYTAGFATVPLPIKQATAYETVKQLSPLFRNARDFTQNDLINDLDERIVELTEKYKRKRIG